VKSFSEKSLNKHFQKIVGKKPSHCLIGVGDSSNKGGFLKGCAGTLPNKKFITNLNEMQQSF